jgi:N-ethylmaleimide reductase
LTDATRRYCLATQHGSISTNLSSWWIGQEQYIGIRISPVNTRNDLVDNNPEPVVLHLVDRLNAANIAYLHVIEGVTMGPRDVGQFDLQTLRKRFKGLYMVNNGYTRELAQETLASGRADLICFGRPFIANPDPAERLRV